MLGRVKVNFAHKILISYTIVVRTKGSVQEIMHGKGPWTYLQSGPCPPPSVTPPPPWHLPWEVPHSQPHPIMLLSLQGPTLPRHEKWISHFIFLVVMATGFLYRQITSIFLILIVNMILTLNATFIHQIIQILTNMQNKLVQVYIFNKYLLCK